MAKKVQDDLQENEYMLSAVPKEFRRPTWKLVMVWIGFGYVATGFVVGATLAGGDGQSGLPPMAAFWAIMIGMGCLFIITSLLGIVAQRTGLNLALICRYSYGSMGTNLPLVIMSLLTIGWFASITGMIAEVWGALIGNPTGIIVFDPAILGYEGIAPITFEEFISTLLFGLLFTFTVYFGIKAIEAVATPISPFILLIAVFAGIGMLQDGGGLQALFSEAGQFEGLGFGTAITIVTGSWIAGVIMGVDFFRFNKNIFGVFLGAFACFIITNPILNIVGYIGAVTTGDYNFVNWMAGYGLVLALIGVISWTAALWTTNNAELYCNALYTGPVIASFKKNVRRKNIVLVVGIIGTVIAALGFFPLFFDNFITILGAAFLPLAGPIIADYYLVKKQKYNVDEVDRQPKYRAAGLISFIIGASIGITFEFFIPMPFGLPSGVFALIISILLYPLLYKFTDDRFDHYDQSSVGAKEA